MIFSRRKFLALGVGLGVGWLVPRSEQGTPPPPLALPTPTVGQATTSEPRVYFVGAEHYHELPAVCYAPNLIRPFEIILHYDANGNDRDLWLTQVTYETMRLLEVSSHFAVDKDKVWQMLPMFETVVQESAGAKGYNWLAINVEMCGRDFDVPDFAPDPNQVRLTVQLVSQLMDFYHIPFAHVVGHFERDDRELKIDPGVQFMATFRDLLRAYRQKVSPLKMTALTGPIR